MDGDFNRNFPEEYKMTLVVVLCFITKVRVLTVEVQSFSEHELTPNVSAHLINILTLDSRPWRLNLLTFIPTLETKASLVLESYTVVLLYR